MKFILVKASDIEFRQNLCEFRGLHSNVH